MIDIAKIQRQLSGAAMSVYTQPSERAALRCALGDAASLCDAMVRETERANRTRGNRVSQGGLALAGAIKGAADAIWAMREMIDVESPATGSTDDGSTPKDDGATESTAKPPHQSSEGGRS